MSGRAKGVAVGVTLALAALARDGRAQGLSVTASNCPDLSPDRVREHLQIELSTLVPSVAEPPALDIDLQCDGPRVRVTLRDSVTAKWVGRDVVPSASAQLDPERSLALAASELFLASWAELLLHKPEEPFRAPDRVTAAAEAAVRRAVPDLAHPPVAEIDLAANGRVRHLAGPVPTLGVALRAGRANSEGLRLFVAGGWEEGLAARSAGHVRIDTAEGGLGLRWGRRLGQLNLDATGEALATYVSMQGVPSTAAFYGTIHAGFTMDFAAGVEASVAVQAFRFGAALAGGYLAPGPVGSVAGDSAVRMDGLWVGTTLFAGFAQ
jgi:hypothetical protein